MGFGAAITGGIITSVILLVGGLTMSALLHINEALVQASNQRNELESEYGSTAIQITSVQVMPSNKTILLFLKNVGSTKRWSFENFDTILQYSSAVNMGNFTATELHTEKLVYKGTTKSLPSGSWGISSFINDTIDPLILNPGETMEIKCVLGNALADNTQLIATIVTDNGVQTTKLVEVP